MTHSQISRVDRRARHNAQIRGASRGRPSDDPQLRRMLTTHIHCGQEMQFVIADPAPPKERVDEGLLTYRCFCGFSFDQRQD